MHCSSIHNDQEMKGKRIIGCKREEKDIGHRDTTKYDSDIMKMQKKKKPFSGICRNLERITVSKEGQIKDKSQHMPSRGY